MFRAIDHSDPTYPNVERLFMFFSFSTVLVLPFLFEIVLHYRFDLLHYYSSQTAGNAVKRAADNLVTAAKSAAIFEEQETTVIINQRFVGGIAQELEAQEKILRIEKELAAARNKLSQIRQAKYRPEDDD